MSDPVTFSPWVVCERVERVSNFSVERAVSQWNSDTGEFLADPTGQTPLLMVRSDDGWRVLTRKSDVPTSAVQELDPLGFAVQMLVGDTNGFLTPYRNVILVPAGMRARLHRDGPSIVGDDLRDFLLANRPSSSAWRDDLLTSPEVTAENGLLFLSGGLDSTAVLLSYDRSGNPLPAAHQDRPGCHHESKFARQAAAGSARELHTVPFQPLTFEEAFADLSASPFGRMSNFGGFRRTLSQLPPTTYVLSGDMNGLDVNFADHSDRYRNLRRSLFTKRRWRGSFRYARRVGGPLSVGSRLSAKVATLTRSFATVRSPILFLVGLVLGPKGFPGIEERPYLKDNEGFIEAVEESFASFFPDLDLGSDTFHVDMYLFNYRWFVGNTDCTGLQEAAESLGRQVRFPYNKAEAVLQQVWTVPEEVIDKRVLKKHFGRLFPLLNEVIWYPKNNTVGACATGYYRPGPDWMRTLDAGFASLPSTAFLDEAALRTFVTSTRAGSYAGPTSETPTERQLHFASLMMRRASRCA